MADLGMRTVSPTCANQLLYENNWPVVNTDENKVVGAFKDFLCTFSAPVKVYVGRRQGSFAAFAGCLYWTLMLGIAVAYLGGLQIVYGNKHLLYEVPIGAIRLHLRRPTQLQKGTDHACSPRAAGCDNNFTDIKDLPYCQRSKLPFDKPGIKRVCKIWDEDSVMARNSGKECFMTTHVKEWNQNKLCDGTGAATNCPVTFKSVEKDNYYLADIENFAVLLSHSMRTPNLIPEMDTKQKGMGIKVCTNPLTDKIMASSRRLRGSEYGDDGDDDDNDDGYYTYEDGKAYEDAEEAPARRAAGKVEEDAAKAAKTAEKDVAKAAKTAEKDAAIAEKDVKAEASKLEKEGEEDLSKAEAKAKKLEAKFRKMLKAFQGGDCVYYKPDDTLLTASKQHADAFKLQTILDAVGADLDKPGPRSHDGKTRREVGMSLAITIHYENTMPFTSWYEAAIHPLPIRYHYTIKELPVREYKTRDTHWIGAFNGKDRLVMEQFGIHVMLAMTGQLGSWSMASLLNLCAVSTTMIFMSERIVTMIVRYGPMVGFGWTSGKLKPEVLGQDIAQQSRHISEPWTKYITLSEEQAQSLKEKEEKKETGAAGSQ